MKPAPRSESQEQIAVVTWARWQEHVYPALRLLHAVPNGGSRAHRTKRVRGGGVVRYSPEGQRMRLEGVKPGVPDLDLPAPRRGYHGLRIEMKAGNGRLSIDQADWIQALRSEGYLVAVCWTADEAICLLEWYCRGQRHVAQPERYAPPTGHQTNHGT